MTTSDPTKQVLRAIQDKLGKTSAMLLDAGTKSDVDYVIPFGIGALDHFVLGCGGLPAGRLVELYGDEGSGKTSTMLTALAGCQAAGGVATLVETEYALDADRAPTFGVDLSRLILMQPGSIEDALDAIQTALDAMPIPKGDSPPNLIAWDSIAATPTRREVEEGTDGKDKVGDRAQKMSKAMRILCMKAAERRTTLLFLNQIRENIGVMFGDSTTTPAGRAVKFHASIRLRLMGGSAVKVGTDHIGKDVTFLAAKNKVGLPWRKAKIRLNYEKGWDDEWTTINLAKDRKVIPAGERASKDSMIRAMAGLGWPMMPSP